MTIMTIRIKILSVISVGKDEEILSNFRNVKFCNYHGKQPTVSQKSRIVT